MSYVIVGGVAWSSSEIYVFGELWSSEFSGRDKQMLGAVVVVWMFCGWVYGAIKRLSGRGLCSLSLYVLVRLLWGRWSGCAGAYCMSYDVDSRDSSGALLEHWKQRRRSRIDLEGIRSWVYVGGVGLPACYGLFC